MKLINYIEKKCGWVQIKNLPLIFAIGYLSFFVLTQTNAISPEKVTLYGSPIIKNNEIWRLFTFIFIPNAKDILDLFFIIYLQWIFGNELESALGSLKLTLYFLSTYFVTIILAFVFPNVAIANSFYLNTFLAFAFLFPNYVLLLFFIIPVKVKWLGIFTCLFGLYKFVESGFAVEHFLMNMTVILPLGLFFGKDIYYKIKYGARKTIINTQQKVSSKKARHQCKSCNITDIIDPKKDFRYIEENGTTNCYCDTHIPTIKNF